VAVYVAQERGLLAAEAVGVDQTHYTGEHVSVHVWGGVDYEAAYANSVLKRRVDLELPIVAVALFGQRGQQAFVSLAESGIQTPNDWEGKTFGYKISVPPDYLAILEANGVDRSKIQEVRVGFDPRILTEKQVDILAVFKSNEPDTLRGLGFEVTVFDASDYGVPTLGLTYITRQDMVDENSDTVQRFVKATMKGLEFAFANTEETLDIIMKFADKENREHQRFMLQTEIDNAASPITDTNGLGWMTAQQWQEFQDSLLQYGALEGSTDVNLAFTDQFLEDIYADGKLDWP